MPSKMHYYEPDQIDCNTMVTALGGDFGALPTITTTYERDKVEVVVKCTKVRETTPGLVSVQAKVSAPLRTARSLYSMQYSALLDCWHQYDRGTLAVDKTPISYSWQGRPQTPRRRKGE